MANIMTCGPMDSKICPIANAQGRVSVTRVDQLPVVTEQRVGVIRLDGDVGLLVIALEPSPGCRRGGKAGVISVGPLHGRVDVLVRFAAGVTDLLAVVGKPVLLL